MTQASLGKKEETRRKIVESAARLFRERGAVSASLPEIMEAAGLTVGGFYRHFESKEDLFQAALESSMRETLELMRSKKSRRTGADWIARAAAVYLDSAHRENVAGGCPLPVLTPEVARREGAVKESFEKMIREIVGEIEAKMPDDGSIEPRERAWGFLACLVGGLLLSRGVRDAEMAEEILHACRHTVELAGSHRD